MRLSTRQLLLFAPLTVVIEWLGIWLDSLYWHPASHQPLSDVSLAMWPAPLIFAVILTLAGLTYAIFTLSLRRYWPPVFWIAVITGLILAIAGWVQYLFRTRLAGDIHGFAILFTVLGYQFIIWQISSKVDQLASLSQVFFWLITAGAVITAVDLATSRYRLDIIEFITFILLQAWSLTVAWFVWHQP